MEAQRGLAVGRSAAPLPQRVSALSRPRRHVCRVARLPKKDAPTTTFKSDSTLPLAAPVRGPAVPWPRRVDSLPQQQQQQQADGGHTPAAQRDGPVGRYLDWWDAIPTQHKIVLAGSLSFVICNMVSSLGHSRHTSHAQQACLIAVMNKWA